MVSGPKEKSRKKLVGEKGEGGGCPFWGGPDYYRALSKKKNAFLIGRGKRRKKMTKKRDIHSSKIGKKGGKRHYSTFSFDYGGGNA